MTYEEVKNAPLNVLVGYLAYIHPGIECPCECKPELWAYKNAAETEKEECQKDGEYDTCPQRLAYERVMDAVEKQMPLKVTNMYRCPNCGLDPTIDNDYMLNYCPHCGQALDWSDI